MHEKDPQWGIQVLTRIIISALMQEHQTWSQVAKRRMVCTPPNCGACWVRADEDSNQITEIGANSMLFHQSVVLCGIIERGLFLGGARNGSERNSNINLRHRSFILPREPEILIFAPEIPLASFLSAPDICLPNGRTFTISCSAPIFIVHTRLEENGECDGRRRE